MVSFSSNIHWTRAAWLSAGLVFVVNWLLPMGVDLSVFYLFPIFLSIYFKEKSDVFLLAVVVTTLSILFLFLRPVSEMDMFRSALLNNIPLLMSIWIAAFLVIRFIDFREAEENQEQKFKAIFEYATNGMVLTDNKGEIIMANPSFERIFGYESGELIGQKIETLLPDRLRHKHQALREGYHTDPKPRTMGTGLDLYGKKKSGEQFPVEVSLSPFSSNHQAFIVAFVIDNTNRKNYENDIIRQKQELTDLTEALGELNGQLEFKVEERTKELEIARDELRSALEKEKELGELKSRFVSMASHEFRTPLSAILSSASLISSYLERGEYGNIKKHAERIKNAVNGLNTILTEFLSLGRLEEGRITANPAPMNVPEQVKEVYVELKTLFRAGQVLDYQHEGPELVQLDTSIFRNILINLISNAIKYSGEGSTVWMKTRSEHDKLWLSIRDEGIGIPTEDQKHLFTRFFRATNATNIHGTGLGLYIVNRYVQMMNGEIQFVSVPEKGTEFMLEFKFHPFNTATLS